MGGGGKNLGFKCPVNLFKPFLLPFTECKEEPTGERSALESSWKREEETMGAATPSPSMRQQCEICAIPLLRSPSVRGGTPAAHKGKGDVGA